MTFKRSRKTLRWLAITQISSELQSSNGPDHLSPTRVLDVSNCTPYNQQRSLLSSLVDNASCVSGGTIFRNTPTNDVENQDCLAFSRSGSTHIHRAMRQPNLRDITNIEIDLSRNFDTLCDDAAALNNEIARSNTEQRDANALSDQLLGESNVSTQAIDDKYIDDENLNFVCTYCRARMWYSERVKRGNNSITLVFLLCCSHGKIQLPFMHPLPPYLQHLFFNTRSPYSKNFLQNIRTYNTMFSFTSMGGKIEKSFNSRAGPYAFVLSGQNYHRISSLLPVEGSQPAFSQLYIYNTANEITNRISVVRHQDGQMYNLPSLSEVAALVVGDLENQIQPS